MERRRCRHAELLGLLSPIWLSIAGALAIDSGWSVGRRGALSSWTMLQVYDGRKSRRQQASHPYPLPDALTELSRIVTVLNGARCWCWRD